MELNTKPKSTIDQQFLVNKGPQHDLTRSLILAGFSESFGLQQDSWQSQLGFARKAYQVQLYNLITDRPQEKHSLTYCVNCRPSGVRVRPYTIACQNRRVCPWCFIRRLDILRIEILKVPTKIRNCNRLLMWKRELPYSGHASLPFFSTRYYGPHKLLDAFLTSQFMFPFLDDSGSLTVTHIGFQIIPKASNVSRDLFGKQPHTIPRMPYHVFDDASDTNVLTAMQSSCRFKWAAAFDKRNFHAFKELFYSYPKQRFIRTSKNYKKEGETRGE